jgi:hypothetical protein
MIGRPLDSWELLIQDARARSGPKRLGKFQDGSAEMVTC